jgi:hypothetical protein
MGCHSFVLLEMIGRSRTTFSVENTRMVSVWKNCEFWNRVNQALGSFVFKYESAEECNFLATVDDAGSCE